MYKPIYIEVFLTPFITNLVAALYAIPKHAGSFGGQMPLTIESQEVQRPAVAKALGVCWVKKPNVDDVTFTR